MKLINSKHYAEHFYHFIWNLQIILKHLSNPFTWFSHPSTPAHDMLLFSHNSNCAKFCEYQEKLEAIFHRVHNSVVAFKSSFCYPPLELQNICNFYCLQLGARENFVIFTFQPNNTQATAMHAQPMKCEILVWFFLTSAHFL